jgi:hypothetical protein
MSRRPLVKSRSYRLNAFTCSGRLWSGVTEDRPRHDNLH